MNHISAIDPQLGGYASADTMDDLSAPNAAFVAALQELDADRAQYCAPRFQAINDRETATADPSPFLLLPRPSRELGVLLVHGFMASPAEMRPLGDALHAAGYPVLGVRLRGHGTSPWDLGERSWRDWQRSVTHGYEVLAAYCRRICVVGFSTGGALALLTGAEQPPALVGLVAIAPALRFQNRNMRYVPLVHGANRVVARLSGPGGLLPFRPAAPEHPHINYRHMPIRGLYELTRMVPEVHRQLPAVACPTLVIQGTQDPVIAPVSARIVYERLGSRDKRLAWVESEHHGIVYRDVGGTHRLVTEFVARIAGR